MKKLTIALIGLALGLPLNAQMGVRLDQFYMDHASIIPAAVGNMEMGGLSLFHNKMFSDVPGSPQHSVMNVSMPMASKNTGFGLYYMRERYGFAETHNTYATYAYTIGLGSTADLSLGVSVGALTQNFDPSKAIYVHDNDPIIKALIYSPAVTRADLRASIYAKGENWFAGASLSRLPKPTFDYSYYNYSAAYDMQTQANFLLGFQAEVGTDMLLKPAVHVYAYDWSYYLFQGNVSLWYQDMFWFGAGANNLGQVGANVGFKPQDDMQFSYAYNTPSGPSRIALGPSHEFQLNVGFSALGGGMRGDGSGDGSGSGSLDEDQGIDGGAVRKEATIRSLEDLENFGLGYDTSGILLPDLEKVASAPGFYLVVGLHSSEAKANIQIKDLYEKDVIAYKMYDPKNKSFYVFVKHFGSEKDANKSMYYFEGLVPQVWIREVR